MNSRKTLALAELPPKRDVATDCGSPGPMSQQNTDGPGRNELHPQKLPQLVGFRDPNARKQSEAQSEAWRAFWPHFINTMVGFWGFQYTQLQKALQLFTSGEADAYMAVSDAMIDGQIQSIIDMAKSKRLPTMLYEPGAVAKGGLATYSADFKEVGRLSAKYVRRVLAGASPADLPVEGIDKVSFVINLKTAKQIGLVIPESILLRANKVIE